VPAPGLPPVSPGGSIYRSGGSLRPSDARPTGGGVHPLSVQAMLDSVNLALPDTNEFTIRDYRPHFSADFVSRPTIGYARDNFGRGLFGGAAIGLSDLLGDHMMMFAGAVNGRISEAQVYAAYANLAHRWNWMVSASQQVYYYYSGQTTLGAGGSYNVLLDRWVVREAGGRAIRPFNRFQRLEVGASLVNLEQSTLNQVTFYDPIYGYSGYDSISVGSSKVAFMPSIALVYDNSLFGYTSPFLGHRYRFEVGQAVGGFQYTQALADWRNYQMIGVPFFTLATRVTFMGRFGRDSDSSLSRMFVGTPDRVRGYTYGSYVDGECASAASGGAITDACRGLNQLIGSRMVVASAEFRFPLLRSGAFGFLPFGLPPIEGAFFYDVGMAWSGGDQLTWQRNIADPDNVRAPVSSYGATVRVNMFGFAIISFDYAIPRNRPEHHGYWIVSLSQPF
jgi:hypothetical protein